LKTKRELWVRWKCPVTVTKNGRFQIMKGPGEGKGLQDAFPVGALSTLLEHLRYTKRMDYKVEGNFLIVEHPFEPGPNFKLRKTIGRKRATSFGCKVEYYWVSSRW